MAVISMLTKIAIKSVIKTILLVKLSYLTFNFIAKNRSIVRKNVVVGEVKKNKFIKYGHKLKSLSLLTRSVETESAETIAFIIEFIRCEYKNTSIGAENPEPLLFELIRKR
jgi:hypothetical protein